nr:hypothetical protein [Achromobacter ruhlandii]
MSDEAQFQCVDKEYPRFHFPGLLTKGTCFIRARVRAEGLVIICAQLYGYNDTSVTQAIEDIREAVVTKLHDDVGLQHLLQPRKWWQRKAGLEEVLATATERSTIIEHWPEGRGMAPGESFAIVEFDDAGKPEWAYGRKFVVAERCGVEPDFLTIDPERLHYR